ncbi:hypothetical protein SSX86_023458 [Deinandra increscens subsp. villosa]|uniref:Uncharacterized protein n=1 Tax=Deinandra increscens subsp. villosa TaxID=3103831 RepID=A0AAP0CKW6_9ASTR
MGRAPCCDKASVKKGPWSPEEDAKLKDFMEKHGTCGNWIALPHKAGLKRCGKSCRLRWLNYLRPNIKHGEFSEDEDRIICSLYASIGSRWSVIASQLQGRTDNDIKNYWNTKLRKKLLAYLPSFQKTPSFNNNPNNFMNIASSSFYNYNPNFMNVNNNINSLFPTTTTTTSSHVQSHTNITDLFSQPGMIAPQRNYLEFQNQNMDKEYYFPEMKESQRVVMFGYDGGEQSCNKDDHEIKQEEQFMLKDFGDQNQGFMMTDHNYNDQKQKGCLKNLEQVKQMMGINGSINVDINRYLMSMNDDDENKTTHIITDGFYRMIDGSN